MRNSFLLFVSVALCAAATPPPTHYLVKRGQTNACDGDLKIPLRTEPGVPASGRSKPITQQTCLDVNHGNAPHYTYHDGDVSTNLVMTTTKPEHTTCEHILEVNMLKAVLESPNGPCSHIKSVKKEAEKATRLKFKEITDILNSPPNLVFVDVIFEQKKGDLVTKSHGGAKYMAKEDDPNLKNRLKAIDHFLNSQTRTMSLQVAAALDAKIEALFPETKEKVVEKWNAVLNYAKTAYEDIPDCSPSTKRDLSAACKPGTRAKSSTKSQSRGGGKGGKGGKSGHVATTKQKGSGGHSKGKL